MNTYILKLNNSSFFQLDTNLEMIQTNQDTLNQEASALFQQLKEIYCLGDLSGIVNKGIMPDSTSSALQT